MEALTQATQTLQNEQDSKLTLDSQKQQDSNETLLETFINEYLEVKNKALQGSNPLYALIDKTRYVIQQMMPLSSRTSTTLKNLTQSIQEPMKIAIIGQFSSGKSTFLNALLGQEILPSGITPITAKICHIVYGNDYALELHYKNGNIATKPLYYMNEVSVAENAKIAFYKLYAPLELLKSMSFLDTPGFNSQNQSDTDTTNAVLESVDGIIWLTLIDNVGKQSEKEIINAHIRRYASKSLCVLNQKDRLKNEDEINTSLEYAKKAFSGLFGDIIAISAKNALQSYSHNNELNAEKAGELLLDSNIQSIVAFLQTHITPLAESAKTRTICTQLRTLLLRYARLSLHAKLRFSHLESLLQDSVQILNNNAIQSPFYKDFPKLFDTFSSHLESLSQHIYNAIERTPQEFTRIEKSFGFTKEIKQSKEVAFLPRERLSLSLNNADSTFARDFTKLGFDIMESGKEFESLLDMQTKLIQDLFIQWYAAFLPPLQSPLLQKTLDEMAQSFHTLALKHTAELKAHLMLFHKILSLNYPLSIALCLSHIGLKIEEAKTKHSKSPDTLPLFNPSLENIRDELSIGFHFHFLQENLLTQPLHKKSIWHFEREYTELCKTQGELLTQYAEKYAHHLKQFQSLIATLKSYPQEQESQK
ncbi:dynamin family protein [Helicobacter cinaedi]|uniref:Putative ATP/GTP binding protein n=1 Tax=Helicobacter cinaedi TaxID=213 RepID=A0A377JLT2_9HELI|nr:dynamin family protein [Helicobacter cinaedi]STP08698.1 putative ATP/GTP binding protein [Helicobacter cinaedi]